jgi:hypothetical protein
MIALWLSSSYIAGILKHGIIYRFVPRDIWHRIALWIRHAPNSRAALRKALRWETGGRFFSIFTPFKFLSVNNTPVAAQNSLSISRVYNRNNEPCSPRNILK